MTVQPFISQDNAGVQASNIISSTSELTFATNSSNITASLVQSAGLESVSPGLLLSGTGGQFNDIVLAITPTGNISAQVGIELNNFIVDDSPYLTFTTASGTPNSPTFLPSGKILGSIEFAGWNGNGYNNSASLTVTSQSDFDTTPTTSIDMINASNLGWHITADGEFNLDGNSSIANSNDVRFNGPNDTNWRIGQNLNAYTTSMVGENTLQIVVGSGSEQPDGFSVGQTGGSSIMELRGADKATLFNGQVSVATDVVVGSNVFVDDTLYASNLSISSTGFLSNLVAFVQSISIIGTGDGGGGGGSGNASVLVNTVANVSNVGIIITSSSEDQVYVEGEPTSGEQNINFNIGGGLADFPFTLYAFVTTPVGTSFSGPATGRTGLCLAAGTLIAMFDGTYKLIEDINYNDRILVWNFDVGDFAESKPLWIKKPEAAPAYNLLTFSDGHVLRTVDQHRIFNKQKGGFSYPMTDDTPLGTISFNQFGKEITLIGKQVIQEPTKYYNVITSYHMNLFANTILTSCRFNNIYPIQDMKFVKDGSDNVELISREEFNTVSNRFYYGLRLSEQRFDIPMIEDYVARLIDKENKL